MSVFLFLPFCFFFNFFFDLSILSSSNPLNRLLPRKANDQKRAWPPLDFSSLSHFYLDFTFRDLLFLKILYYNIQCLGKSTKGSVWSLPPPSLYPIPPFLLLCIACQSECMWASLHAALFVKKNKKQPKTFLSTVLCFLRHRTLQIFQASSCNASLFAQIMFFSVAWTSNTVYQILFCSCFIFVVSTTSNSQRKNP